MVTDVAAAVGILFLSIVLLVVAALTVIFAVPATFVPGMWPLSILLLITAVLTVILSINALIASFRIIFGSQKD